MEGEAEGVRQTIKTNIQKFFWVTYLHMECHGYNVHLPLYHHKIYKKIFKKNIYIYKIHKRSKHKVE